MQRAKKKTSPRTSAFITTVAVAATITTLAAGCDMGVTSNPPPPETGVCPKTSPKEGDNCARFVEGLACDYAIECERWERATCGQDATWTVESGINSCNPPAPKPCPETLPKTGDDCSPSGFEDIPVGCSYTVTTSCGEQQLAPSCKSVAEAGDMTHVWVVEAPSCSGQQAACEDYEHPDLCAADSACRYLRPGCAEEAQQAAPEGCFAATNCEDNSCAAGETCTTVVNNPCPELIPGEATCGACGSDVSICLASP